MRLAVPEDLPHAFASRFEEHLVGALAADAREEADQELVAGERAVGHLVEGDGVGQPAGAVDLEPVGEQEKADLRARDGVVAVSDGIDDGFVDDIQIVRRVRAAGRPAGRSCVGCRMNWAAKATAASIWSGARPARRSAWTRSSEDRRSPE